MKQFILVLFAILSFNSCGETDIEEETNPYMGVKIQKISDYEFLKEKFGEPLYKNKPLKVEVKTLDRNGKIIEVISYDSTGQELDVDKYGGGGIEISKYDERAINY